MKIMKYVLLGSLGNINKPLAEKLIAAGNQVTIVSSNVEREVQITAIGAKAAIGSVEDVNFLTNAFTGTDAIFTLIPPVHDTANWKQYIHTIGKNFADAIKASGVKKVVNLSSIGAHLPDGCGPVSGLYFAELELNKLDEVAIKHLRPGYFYTNLFANIGMIKHNGILGNNYGADNTIVLSHPNDIAVVAAEELINLDFTGKSILYVASDERTSKQITAVIGTAIGIPNLPYVEFTDEQNINGAIQAGLPKEIAFNFIEMGKAMRSGEMFADYKKHPVEFGKTKLEDFAKEFATAYQNS
jgi:uncharacterized protein YbjT (DUF2867 family)